MTAWCEGRAWVAVLVLGVAGCGGGDDDADAQGSATGVSAAAVASYEGLYALGSLTRNTAGCDAEGASTRTDATEAEFVVVGVETLGIRYLQLASCMGTNDCADKADAIVNLRGLAADYSVSLSEERGPDELGGLTAWGGFEMNGTCIMREWDDHVLTREADAVRIESRTIPLADAPPEDGLCWAEPSKQRSEAKGRPCTELRVITGTKTGPLP